MPEATLEGLPDTILFETETPSLDAEETTVPGDVETGDAELTEETEQDDSPLAGLSDEELAANTRVAKLLDWERAKAEKSKSDYRTQVEREAKEAADNAVYQQRLTASQSAINGGFKAAIMSQFVPMIENAEHLDARGNPAKAAAYADMLARQMGDAVFIEQYSGMRDYALQSLPTRYDGWKPEPEVVANLEQATRSANPRAMFDALVGLAESAVTHGLSPKLRAELEKELGENGKVAAKATETERAGETRASAQQPTQVATGKSAGRTPAPKTQVEANRLFNEEKITATQLRDYRSKLPYS